MVAASSKDAVASRDSTLVMRYKAAGLNIFGKTASPEFGMTTTTESKLYGVTPNPGTPGIPRAVLPVGLPLWWRPAFCPWVMPAMVAAPSRIPAAHCGLFGTQAQSWTLLPAGPGALDGATGLSVNHVISRSVRDTALLLDLSAGPEFGSRGATSL